MAYFIMLKINQIIIIIIKNINYLILFLLIPFLIKNKQDANQNFIILHHKMVKNYFVILILLYYNFFKSALYLKEFN